MSLHAMRFIEQNGKLWAYEFDDGFWRPLNPAKFSWSKTSDGVLVSKYDDGMVIQILYVDVDDDGIYWPAPPGNANGAIAAAAGQRWAGGAGEVYDGDNLALALGLASEPFAAGTIYHGDEAYRFDSMRGILYHIEDGAWQPPGVEGGFSWQISSNKVVTSLARPWGVELKHYVDDDGDGAYVLAMVEANIAPQGNGPRLQQLLGIYSDGDDVLIVPNGQITRGGLGADRFVIREGGHLVIEDFNPSEDHIVFDVGLGLSDLAQVAAAVTAVRYDGQKTVVEFGEAATITLIGVDPAMVPVRAFEVLS